MQSFYPQFQILYPPQPFPMTRRQLRSHLEKNIEMMTASLYLGITLILFTAVFLVLFSGYVVTYKKSSGVPGVLQALIYVMQVTNLVYAVATYFMAASTRETYVKMKDPFNYSFIAVILLHVAVLIFLIVVIVINGGQNTTLFYILAACVLNTGLVSAIFGVLQSLYFEVKYSLVPLA
eukprot:TRINITY_DN828_c0_g1_i10.p1 TRINITY_DN828_c0_g1~~TRINITY_DN828_c0_g1_i10.p1  ORF type:complete len:178 (+),score=33.68 TRINITY_DN828_c0_g1_i10:77-610(+)